METSIVKRRKKENVRKSWKQAKLRLIKWCRGLVDCLVVNEEKVIKLFSFVKQGKQVPSDLQIAQEMSWIYIPVYAEGKVLL